MWDAYESFPWVNARRGLPEQVNERQSQQGVLEGEAGPAGSARRHVKDVPRTEGGETLVAPGGVALALAAVFHGFVEVDGGDDGLAVRPQARQFGVLQVGVRR